MDTKLKALKVVDLKDILAVAAVPVPARATKADLISKILASQPARDAYARKYGPAPNPPPAPVDLQTDDLLAPPEEVDWNAGDATPSAEVPVKPSVAPVSIPAVLKSPANPPSKVALSEPQNTAQTTAMDSELEKRKQRAERFGIPLVEPKTAPKSITIKDTASKSGVSITPLVNEDPDKLKARAQRFGIPAAASEQKPSVMDRKRSAPSETVDAEEMERRKKRAERFGLPVTA